MKGHSPGTMIVVTSLRLIDPLLRGQKPFQYMDTLQILQAFRNQ